MKKGSSKPLSEKLTKYTVNPVTFCWEWTGSRDRDGYGRMVGSVNGQRWFAFAHRKSFEFHKTKIPDQMQVLHHCDNPCCINPEHLYLGTPKENGEDKSKRGRAKTTPMFGKDNPMYGRTGKLNPFYGKKHTEASKLKMTLTKKRNKEAKLQ